MCKILISIKPEYVKKIFDGSKKIEYRTRLAKYKVDKIIIYCTAPIKKIVGEADVIRTISDKPEKIWSKTKKISGISKESFDTYFTKNKTANAYVLGDVKKYRKQKTLEDFGLKAAPQSFYYL